MAGSDSEGSQLTNSMNEHGRATPSSRKSDYLPRANHHTIGQKYSRKPPSSKNQKNKRSTWKSNNKTWSGTKSDSIMNTKIDVIRTQPWPRSSHKLFSNEWVAADSSRIRSTLKRQHQTRSQLHAQTHHQIKIKRRRRIRNQSSRAQNRKNLPDSMQAPGNSSLILFFLLRCVYVCNSVARSLLLIHYELLFLYAYCVMMNI